MLCMVPDCTRQARWVRWVQAGIIVYCENCRDERDQLIQQLFAGRRKVGV